MKVLVLKGGKTAKDEEGNIHDINGLELKALDRKSEPIFYDVKDKFFKAACPEGTTHYATKLLSEKINLH